MLSVLYAEIALTAQMSYLSQSLEVRRSIYTSSNECMSGDGLQVVLSRCASSWAVTSLSLLQLKDLCQSLDGERKMLQGISSIGEHSQKPTGFLEVL